MPRTEIEGDMGLLKNSLWKIFETIRARYGLEISSESLDKLSLANQYLTDHPLVCYANHQLAADAMLIPMLSALPNTRVVFGPAAEKYYQWTSPFTAAFYRLILPRLHIYALPVVRPQEQGLFTGDHRHTRRNNYRVQTLRLLRPGAIYGIAPEGTRNQDGLHQAKSGIGNLSDLVDTQLIYLPIGLVYPQQDHNPRIVIGAPRPLQEIYQKYQITSLPPNPKDRSQFIADLLMFHLAQECLPRYMHGFYAD